MTAEQKAKHEARLRAKGWRPDPDHPGGWIRRVSYLGAPAVTQYLSPPAPEVTHARDEITGELKRIAPITKAAVLAMFGIQPSPGPQFIQREVIPLIGMGAAGIERDPEKVTDQARPVEEQREAAAARVASFRKAEAGMLRKAEEAERRGNIGVAADYRRWAADYARHAEWWTRKAGLIPQRPQPTAQPGSGVTRRGALARTMLQEVPSR